MMRTMALLFSVDVCWLPRKIFYSRSHRVERLHINCRADLQVWRARGLTPLSLRDDFQTTLHATDVIEAGRVNISWITGNQAYYEVRRTPRNA